MNLTITREVEGGKNGKENKTEVQNRKEEGRQTKGERVVKGDGEGGTR